MVKVDTLLKKNSNMVTRNIGDETVLLPICKTSNEVNCIYSLNKPASRAWELINGKRTLGDIKKIVSDEFSGTPREIDTELGKLLKDLKKIKAVV